MNFNAFSIRKKSYKTIDEEKSNFYKISKIQTDLLYGVNSKEQYFITVIIPTYNRSALLKEAIDSVLQQKSDFKWELIIVDNTPLDHNKMTPALKIVQALNDSSIKYYHNRQNIGSGYNWNRAVELAQGKWITFLHDDDVLCSDALENIYKIIMKPWHFEKPLGYIHARNKGFTNTFDEKTIKFKRLPFHLELTRFTTLILGHTHTGMPTCGTTILKEAYVKAGGINYDFGPTADAVLGYLIMKDYTVLRSGMVLGGYRWVNNETLKISTIEKLIYSDSLFAQYRYGLTPFSKVWGKLFANAQMQDNINAKLTLIKKYGAVEDCKISNFLIRKHVTPILLYVYKIITLICKVGMAIKGILWLR